MCEKRRELLENRGPFSVTMTLSVSSVNSQPDAEKVKIHVNKEENSNHPVRNQQVVSLTRDRVTSPVEDSPLCKRGAGVFLIPPGSSQAAHTPRGTYQIVEDKDFENVHI